jgi:hypothetical protein
VSGLSKKLVGAQSNIFSVVKGNADGKFSEEGTSIIASAYSYQK